MEKLNYKFIIPTGILFITFALLYIFAKKEEPKRIRSITEYKKDSVVVVFEEGATKIIRRE